MLRFVFVLMLLLSPTAFAADADQAVELLKASLQCATPPKTSTDAYNATHRVITTKGYSGNATMFSTDGKTVDYVHDKSEIPLSGKTGNDLWSITSTRHFSAPMLDVGNVSVDGASVVIECVQVGKQCIEENGTSIIHWPASHCAVQSVCGGPDVQKIQKRYKKLTLNLCDHETASNVKAALDVLTGKSSD